MLLYTTGFVLHKNEHLHVEHGGRTRYMYPKPNVTRQDMGHRESTNILPQILEGHSASECLRSESTATTGRKEKKERHGEKLRKIALA